MHPTWLPSRPPSLILAWRVSPLLSLILSHAGNTAVGRLLMTITMSYGGGKQTVAIVTLILEGKLPKPDFMVIADTGREACKIGGLFAIVPYAF